jgi:mycofactocin precursor
VTEIERGHIIYVCAARESVMSEGVATVDIAEATALAEPQAGEPELAADLLVEEVSIDGMCGVY